MGPNVVSNWSELCTAQTANHEQSSARTPKKLKIAIRGIIAVTTYSTSYAHNGWLANEKWIPGKRVIITPKNIRERTHLQGPIIWVSQQSRIFPQKQNCLQHMYRSPVQQPQKYNNNGWNCWEPMDRSPVQHLSHIGSKAFNETGIRHTYMLEYFHES